MKKISLVSSLLCTALVFGCGDDGKPGATGATGPTTASSNTNQTSDSTDGMSETGASTDDSTTSGVSSMPSTDPTTPTTTSGSPTSDTTPTSDGTTGDTTGNFIVPADGGAGMKECDPWTQDCDPGEKCMPYSGDGDSSWESLKCVPIMENPGQTGDPCTVEGSGVSGIDSCDLAHMCWNTDVDTGEGTCVKFCSGSEDAPTCTPPNTHCTIVNDGVLILCLPTCDPLLQDCLAGDLCIPSGDSFICVLDASGEEGQEFDPCEYGNACDPGFYCLNPQYASECDPNAGGCCLAFCDLQNAQCNGAGAECLAWYEEGQAPPGYENVGVCGIPS